MIYIAMIQLMLKHGDVLLSGLQLPGQGFNLELLLIDDLIGFDDRRYHETINRPKEIICQQLSFMNISFAHFFRHDSFQEKSQLQPINAAVGGTLLREPEAALLQAFIPEGKTVAVPVQALEQVAAAVDEHKERTVKRVGTHIRAHQPAQGVKGLSHVARDPVKIDAGSGAQG